MEPGSHAVHGLLHGLKLVVFLTAAGPVHSYSGHEGAHADDWHGHVTWSMFLTQHIGHPQEHDPRPALYLVVDSPQCVQSSATQLCDHSLTLIISLIH